MWTFIIIIFIIAFLYGIICNYADEHDPVFLSWILIVMLAIMIFGATSANKNNVNYFSKDIRVNSEVIYNNVEYGKIDSISYYINGKLIPYKNINKVN